MILSVCLNPAIDKTYSIDHFVKGKVSRVASMNSQPGGKGINVARVAKELGASSIVTGFVGGSSGHYLKNGLYEIGIEHQFVDVQGETRTCLNVIDKKNGSSTEILEQGPIINQTSIDQLKDEVMQFSRGSKVIVMSGSLPSGVPATMYAELLTMLQTANVPVLLDTSGEALSYGIRAAPFFVKPNEHEIKALSGKAVKDDNRHIQSIHWLLEQGISCPVISLGKQGAYAGNQNKLFRIKPPEVKAVNSVGSGDAFVAGMAVGIANGYSIEDCFRWAAAAGAANTLSFGAGVVRRKDVNALLSEVGITQL